MVKEEETVDELLREYMIETIKNTRKVNKELDLILEKMKKTKEEKENPKLFDDERNIH